MTARRRVLATALLAAAGVAGLGAGTASAAWFSLPDLAVNPPGQAIEGPSVAMTRDGTAFVALTHFDGAHTRVGVAMHVPGGGFGPVRDLSPAGTDAYLKIETGVPMVTSSFTRAASQFAVRIHP